ncbi:MAG TPA: hypothetical protein VFQ61_27250 [Polyangiaceae bacterium]|nr:hypothetical protein [Polyangiaceae bacterium]
MSQAGSMGGSGRIPEHAGFARESEAKANQQQAERWAQVLLPYVAQVLPPAAPETTAPAGSPTTWRVGDGALTLARGVPLTAGSVTDPTQHDSPDDSLNRVHVTVRTPEMGDLSLVLERGEAGLRVVIGVENSNLGQQLLPEQRALVQSLVGSGVKLQSLSIVNQSELGTVLAQTANATRGARPGNIRGGAAQAAFTDSDGEARSGTEKARRRSRKLDFIG